MKALPQLAQKPRVEQIPLPQSAPRLQELPSTHFGQSGPPQSVAVS